MEPRKILAFLFIFHTTSVNCAVTVRQTIATQQTQASGYVFSDNLLWMKHVRSMIECHVLCTNDVECATFTFTRHGVGVAGVCRAHDKDAGQNTATWLSNSTTLAYMLPERYYAEDVTVTSDVTTLASAKTTALTTPAVTKTTEAPCVSDGDCPGSDWICLQGKCLCQLGSYYSVGSDTCVSDCKEADLLDEFVIYNGYHLEATLPLLGWTPIFSQTSTVERCRVQCVVRSDCIAVNFDTGTQECEGVPKAALNLLNDLLQPFQSVPTAAFMPRLCN